MSNNHDASIKNLEVHIGQLSRQTTTLYGSIEGFISNTIDNPKNESCKVVEISFEVITDMGEDEIMEEELMEKEEVRTERD